jgi:hypothetical protein
MKGIPHPKANDRKVAHAYDPSTRRRLRHRVRCPTDVWTSTTLRPTWLSTCALLMTVRRTKGDGGCYRVSVCVQFAAVPRDTPALRNRLVTTGVRWPVRHLLGQLPGKTQITSARTTSRRWPANRCELTSVPGCAAVSLYPLCCHLIVMLAVGLSVTVSRPAC